MVTDKEYSTQRATSNGGQIKESGHIHTEEAIRLGGQTLVRKQIEEKNTTWTQPVSNGPGVQGGSPVNHSFAPATNNQGVNIYQSPYLEKATSREYFGPDSSKNYPAMNNYGSMYSSTQAPGFQFSGSAYGPNENFYAMMQNNFPQQTTNQQGQFNFGHNTQAPNWQQPSSNAAGLGNQSGGQQSTQNSGGLPQGLSDKELIDMNQSIQAGSRIS